MRHEQRQQQAHHCADRSGDQERVRPLALFVCQPGDVIHELTPVALVEQIVQHCQVRVRRGLQQHLVRAQGPFDPRRIHGDVVSGLAGILDREDRARQHHLKIEFARIAIVIADGMAEQVGTHCESDVGYLDGPLPKLLTSGTRVLGQGIGLQQPDEGDKVRTLLRSRRATRLDRTRLKRTGHQHPGERQLAK